MSAPRPLAPAGPLPRRSNPRVGRGAGCDIPRCTAGRARQFAFTAAVPDGTPVTLTEHDAHRWSPLDGLRVVSGHHREILDRLQ
ncbi:hypothetical protein [Kitasatospora sp. NPDC090308]|uniref:hypothetical protein n=1 Tax=Kitasatospora sp. NPDC090308 TaxID=3364082 RepID=UPI0038096280